MGQIRVGDHVEATAGKRQGQIGKVTNVTDERVLVQFDGLPYERSFKHDEVNVTRKASKDFEFRGATVPPTLHGDKKVKITAYLVKTKQLCPSWPHSCAGTCDASNTNESKRITENTE